ncbi:MAG TPA: hypothetical protein VGZ93_00980 [Candidatus Methylacidiphilales bacterium]|jgi:hypothetical protein|nr:hypothetical protein [Candidatus Methylacidiphilales bacterium]
MPVILLLLIAGIFPLAAQSWTPLDANETQKYAAVALDMVQREEAFLKENHLWSTPGIPPKFYAREMYHSIGQQNVIELSSANPIFRIELLPGSAQIVSFANWTSQRTSNHYYAEPPKLKWTPEEAVALATGYAKAILGAQMPDNLRPPYVHSHQETDLPRYMDSSWMVMWGQTDKEGHRFRNGSIVVLLTDGHGPTNLGYNFWSHYDDKAITPIAQDKALALAAEGAKQILAWAPGAMWLKNYELVGTPTMELMIVNPNHLSTLSSVQAMGHVDLNARLAWVAVYKKTYTGPPVANNFKPTGGALEVWIDAENGQLLGGDFK